jgi:hypothetical protein
MAIKTGCQSKQSRIRCDLDAMFLTNAIVVVLVFSVICYLLRKPGAWAAVRSSRPWCCVVPQCECKCRSPFPLAPPEPASNAASWLVPTGVRGAGCGGAGSGRQWQEDKRLPFCFAYGHEPDPQDRRSRGTQRPAGARTSRGARPSPPSPNKRSRVKNKNDRRRPTSVFSGEIGHSHSHSAGASGKSFSRGAGPKKTTDSPVRLLNPRPAHSTVVFLIFVLVRFRALLSVRGVQKHHEHVFFNRYI